MSDRVDICEEEAYLQAESGDDWCLQGLCLHLSVEQKHISMSVMVTFLSAPSGRVDSSTLKQESRCSLQQHSLAGSRQYLLGVLITLVLSSTDLQ